jgi:two-component system, sensor histidine kinase and response regulator
MARRQCVLVVDDDELARETLVSMLTREPVDVVEASSGAQALEVAARQPVDAILLDVMMPGMTGFETCRRLKADPRLAPIPVIFVTALDSHKDLLEGFDAGAEEFVSKPVNRTEMRARVRSMLRMKAQYDALQEMNERLSHLSRLREEMASFLVHDLKNPLAIISANASLCRDRTLPLLVREAAADIAEASRTMDRMVMDLLDVARSDERGLAPRLGEVKIGEIVEETVEAQRSISSARKIKVSIVGDVEAVVRADRDLLRRVLANLLDNGLKYAPSGSAIEISTSIRDGVFELRQRDGGTGIAPADREKIFDRYRRVEKRGDSHARTSRGLGLAFCKLAVEAHGGRIWVEDAEPRGTIFCFTIPQDV